jgi:hypothetical protein
LGVLFPSFSLSHPSHYVQTQRKKEREEKEKQREKEREERRKRIEERERGGDRGGRNRGDDRWGRGGGDRGSRDKGRDGRGRSKDERRVGRSRSRSRSRRYIDFFLHILMILYPSMCNFVMSSWLILYSKRWLIILVRPLFDNFEPRLYWLNYALDF